MASKKSPAKSSSKKVAAKATSTTAVRHTAIPKVEAVAAATPVTKMVTTDMVAARAYEIWTRTGGSEMENWLRAESELRAA